MRSLDTNVLVRYLTADHPKQLAAAERIIEECRDNEEPIYLTVLVLCELVWVLSRRYGQSKAQIVETFEQIIQMEQLRIENDALVRRSLEMYKAGKGNFADYVIGEISAQAGCRDTVTFDRALRGAPGFTLPR